MLIEFKIEFGSNGAVYVNGVPQVNAPVAQEHALGPHAPAVGEKVGAKAGEGPGNGIGTGPGNGIGTGGAHGAGVVIVLGPFVMCGSDGGHEVATGTGPGNGIGTGNGPPAGKTA
jgi:hypothetical protein